MTGGTIWVQFTSDWHVGTGAGRSGDVDRLIARETVRVDDSDPVEVPFLPAKTLTGILRDAAERLAFGLDVGTDKGPWSDYVRWIFGEAGQPAALSVRPGHLSDALVVALSEDRTALQGLTTTRASTAIDPVTGTAVEHTLRNIEVGRPGTVFDAVWHLDDARAPTVTVEGEKRAVDAAHFLATAAALVDGIGAKRRRGLGRCSLRVRLSNSAQGGETLTPAAEVGDLLRQANADEHGDSSGQADEGSAGNDNPVPDTPAQDRQKGLTRLEVRLIARTSLLVGTTSFGNVVESSDYIPGRLLFPIVCGALRDLGLDPARLIDGNLIRVSDANPIHAGSSERLEAVPYAFSRIKEPDDEGRTKVMNTLAELQGEQQAKQLRAGFVLPTGGGGDGAGTPIDSLGLVRAVRAVSTHNSIDDESQRPDESTGGVFTYDALAAGQRFSALVDLPSDAASKLKEWLEGRELGVGRSAKDDYGLVVIEGVDETSSESAPPSVVDKNQPEQHALIVWCLSDVILDDDRLRQDPTAAALASSIAAAWDHKVSLSIEPNHVRIRSRRIDGFNRQSGVPAATRVVIERGSAMRLTVRNDPDGSLAAVSDAELFIGNRIAEGFGRVVLNPGLLLHSLANGVVANDLETTFLTSGRTIRTSGHSGEVLAPADVELLDRAQMDGYLAEIRRRIPEVVAENAKLQIPGETLSRSATGELRRRLLNHIEPNGSDGSEEYSVASWLASRREAFIGVRPDERAETWFDQALEILRNPTEIWTVLCGSREEGGSDAAESTEDSMERKLWQPAVTAFFEHLDRSRDRQSAVTTSARSGR